MARGASVTDTPSAPTLLIVDDERTLRFGIGEWARDAGFVPVEAEGGAEALSRLREGPVDAVILDLKLGDEDGLEVLRALREEDALLPVVMLTGHGTIEHAVKATKLGAYEFIVKPPNLEHLGVVLRRALEHAGLRREVEHLRTRTLQYQPLLGDSPGLKKTLGQLEKAARAGAFTVLVLGETGSGKELMARFLHAQSPRAGGPFVELNCGAIPENLLESELFGHEKGAFTDAKRFKKGLFESAHQGTLFLDEIGEMSFPLQSKLLRVLENRTFRRVGGNEDITVDVRVVAATHRDLRKHVADGKFREDLFFRLNVLPVVMPPLRERPEDVPVLAQHFIRKVALDLGRPPARVHPEALALLQAYAWPGNVRELRNVVERVLLLESDEEILPHHLPPEITGGGAGGVEPGSPFPAGVVRPLAEIERLAIEHALRVCDGNKTRAAEKLGISRQTLRTKLKEYGMKDDSRDEGEAAAEA